MKKLLSAILLLTMLASPAFAKRHRSKPPHPNYNYKAPKSYKAHIHRQKQKQHHAA